MKYIDAEKLLAEIERRRLSNRYIDTEGYENELMEIITSLQQEQPEMDLEKERKNLNPTMLTYAAEVFGGKTLLEDISYSYRRELADYFNGLVKAARKEK